MGRLRFISLARAVASISLFLFLPGCGGRKPPGPSPFPVRITLNPAVSYSIQVGTTVQFSASAQNSANQAIAPGFTFSSSNPGVLDVAPNGAACAGSWNAPLYTTCTAAGIGVAQVTASALGASSAPTLIFVHPPIDNIQISVVPPVNSPPPACPNQGPLPAACNIAFNTKAVNYCLSQNQVQTLQATAFSQGVDITGSVGPFTWSETSLGVATVTSTITSSTNVATNQATAIPGTPGQTQIIASSSGVSSQPYNFEACPVQCIALDLGVNGSHGSGATSFVTNKGTSETITATAVDVQGCIVPKPHLSWTSSSQAALAASGCSGNTCAVATTQAGVAAITASCTPPTCNIGFPLNPAGFPAPYVPQAVYPVTAISGLVTGTATATSVLATSQDCFSDELCAVGLYDVATSNNQSGGGFQFPNPPNSLLFDAAGDKAYAGSEFGAATINPASFGTSNPFATLAAPGTPLGRVTGKVLAVSSSGNLAIFSDTVSTPNQVYVVNSSSGPAALNINSAIAAAFSPDGLKTFILGDGGNTLYVYSTLQALQSYKLAAPATSIVFSSSGSFALLSGGSAASTLAIRNTCDNSAVILSAGSLPGPPLFVKMVPPGNVLTGTAVIPAPVQSAGLDFFFGLDSTGIDVIATNSSQPLPTSICPQPVALAQTATAPLAPFALHINIGQGTFHPINFFLSPDATLAYIVTSDLGVLVYDFNTHSVSTKIGLVNNATPVAADITADGSLIYVAGSDGLLHELNTAQGYDQNQTSFPPLPNSPNNFCFTGANCQLNLVAVRP